MQKDNSTFEQKALLRNIVLGYLDDPAVLEAFGGFGKLFDECYSHITQGIVIEKDIVKSGILAKQRPTWAVYEADCVTALSGGAGNHLVINFLDIDPYGNPWAAIDAFLESKRQFPRKLVIVVTDGLRTEVQFGRAWSVKSLNNVVLKYGNDLYPRYLEICKEMLTEKMAKAGYNLGHFIGYYCGENNSMTHYAAIGELS